MSDVGKCTCWGNCEYREWLEEYIDRDEKNRVALLLGMRLDDVDRDVANGQNRLQDHLGGEHLVVEKEGVA